MRLILVFLFIFAFSGQAYSACGANTRKWQADAGTTAWNTNNNWTPRNRPNAATENALIVSDWRIPAFPASNFSLGCFEISSGSLTVDQDRRLTIVGDYFKNIHSGSLVVNPANTWEVIMQGTADQDFTNVDPIPRLRINNPNTVNITESFSIFNRFRIIDGSGVINIDKGLTIDSTAGNVTIPATATVVVKSGALFKVDRNLTIDGVLRIEAGGKLSIGSGRTLSVSAGGLLQLDGASGSIATIDSISGTFNFNVIGDINLNYFSISRTGTAGINITGSIQAIDNGDFQNIAANGAAMTFAASASVPATADTIGFFDAGVVGTQKNINATAYNGSIITFSNYSGLGGTADETDPNNKLDWGDAADPALQVTNASASGIPAASIASGSTDSHVATFAFSMTGTAATATDLTSIKLTLGGSNLASDIENLKVMKDNDGNCIYNAGTDTQIGSTLYPAGSPASDTLSLGAAVLSVIDTTQACVHVLATINSTAQDANTVSIKIAATNDVINSEVYDWSASGSPPVQAGTFIISGSGTRIWNGGNSGTWTTANDWSPSGVPNSTLNCQIGSGYTNADFPNNTERQCQNIILQTAGTIDWQNRTTRLSAFGSLTIGSGYNFTSAANGSISMRGSTNQSINAQTTYPGDLVIASTGGNVSLDTDWQIDGDFTLTSGNFIITAGQTFTVLGNINLNGGSFTISPGATLVVGNGRAVTVAAASSLIMVGNMSQNAAMTSESNANSYSVVVNGTISARYYSFSNLAAAGVTINSGATINATNHLQDGSFTRPVANSTTMLTLNRKVPTDTLENMVFDSNGSGATGTQAIATSTTAGTLTMSNFSGDRTDDPFSLSDPNYVVSWGTATNTIKLTQEATSPVSVNQGETYNMGRFGFEQTTAGSFNNTSITDLTLTITGTADSADISVARLYYDSGCAGTGGSLIGTASFSGTPAKATFSGMSAAVEADVTTPPKRCIYVELDIDSLATAGQTVGLSIVSSSDVTNSEVYAFNGAAAPSVDLGSPAVIIGDTTVWTGNTSTAWNNIGNWSAGIPTASINCVINNAANDPIVTGTQACKSLTSGNGIITLGGGSTLEIYGSFENTGTFNQAGNTFLIRDNGATPVTQNIKSTSTFDSISFNKTAGGTVTLEGSIAITNNLQTGSGNDFCLQVLNGATTSLIGGLQVNGACFEINEGATVQIASGQSILVNGGQFKTLGTNDAYPQSLSSKAKIEAISGRYSFNASSGTVQLRGFLIDDLDDNGVNFSGAVNISQIDGGQLRSLSTNYASLKAFQFNNSGSKPSLITNVGWQWDSVPANTEAYKVAASSGCGGAGVNISFDGWFGNWYESTPTFDVSTKVSNTACNITLDGSASPVSLTAFAAKGFDSAVELTWTTGLEFEHQGFNVYRSNSPDLGFAQVNGKLIRNSLYSTTIHGEYNFHDLSAVNGETYYYLLEDISTSGARKWHGPISAKALASNGAIPAPGAGDIFETTDSSSTASSDDATPSNPTPDRREIATNIEILSETSTALRLKIVVPAFTTNASAQAGYDDIKIDGHSLTQIPGQAKLPYRTILVNIPDATSATYSIVSQTSTTSSPHDIVPADNFVVSGTTLVAQPTIDNNYYAQNVFGPDSSISLGSVTKSAGRTILPLTVKPIHYNPQSRTIKHFSEIIVDIFLDGRTDWRQTADSSSVWGVEGGLKVGIEKEGLYKVSYDDLVIAGTDAPFDGAHIDDLKLYIKGIELPIRVDSADTVFNSGDEVLFYSPTLKNIYSRYTHLLLKVDDGSGDGLRMHEVSADPTGTPLSSANGFNTVLHFEKNLKEYFREPYSSDEDHILWATFYSPPVNAGDDYFTQEIILDDLVQEGDVEIHALLKGGRLGNFNDLTHHVSLWVNETETSASVTFPTSEPYLAIFKVPANTFSPGRNKIQFQAKATYISTTDLVDIDYFKVHYRKNWSVKDDAAKFESYDYDQNLLLENFTTNDISVLDITDITNINYLTDLNISGAASDFSVEFNQAGGRKFLSVGSAGILTPSTLSLTNGSHLGSTSNRAKILYVGPNDLLDAISPLADYRESEGHTYKKIAIEEIYNEFGKGEHSADAIKSFIEFAYKNWAQKPQYLVLLGDSTYDPKGQLGTVPRNSIPLKFLKGKFYDYGSDNWYVTFGDAKTPQMSVGRIPGNKAFQIEAYAQKVIDYEEGRASAATDFEKQIQLIIDKDQAADTFENFDQKADRLKERILSLTPGANITDTRRSTLSNADTQSSIESAFNNGSSVIHYLGHGAEDMWADYGVFTNDEAKALTNTDYPFVVAMNCLNSYFYYNSEDDKGLAEELVLNPEGGAIAFWGSTSLTNPNEQNPFQDAFYNELLSSGQPIGEVIRKAKVQGGTNGSAEVVNSWTLIGDPLLKIKVVQKKKPSSAASAGGGCSVRKKDIPWYVGLMEMLFMFGLLLFTRRFNIQKH